MKLILYVKHGCHLCDSMWDELEQLQQDFGFTFKAVDIIGDQELTEKYGELIPVLYTADQEICRYVLDPVKLKQALETE